MGASKVWHGHLTGMAWLWNCLVSCHLCVCVLFVLCVSVSAWRASVSDAEDMGGCMSGVLVCLMGWGIAVPNVLMLTTMTGYVFGVVSYPLG